MTEDVMVGWHHRLDGHEFEQAQGDDAEQGSLAYCSPWCCKELDMTEPLKNNNNTFITFLLYRGTKSATTKCVSLMCGLFQAENNQGLKDSGSVFDLKPHCMKEFRQKSHSQNRVITRDM